MSETCKGCKFWADVIQSRPGTCHRFPPSLMNRSQQNGLHGLAQYDYHFPETSPDDWCGEFKPLSTDATTKEAGE